MKTSIKSGTALATLSLIGAQAFAQPALEEVMVTAQKRSESLQDVSVTVNVMDGSRLEVLKGPQSTLFGKNTIAGAIAMHSSLPTDEFEARLSALYGSDGQGKAEAMWSGPVADTVALRLAGVTRTTDGYIDNDFNGDTGPENDQLALTPASGQWRIAVIGKNLTDETHYNFNDDAPLGNGNVFGMSDASGSFIAITAPPRSYAVEATWYFR